FDQPDFALATGRTKTRSAKTTDRIVGEREAAKWEAELREGRYQAPLKMTWREFRERYENEVMNGLAKETDHKVHYILNKLERIINPTRLCDVTAGRLSYFQAKLRDKKLSENSIKSYLAHIGAALRWAVRMGLLAKAPAIEMPRRAKGSKMMKGRPITREEFERMLEAVPKVLTSHTRGRKLLPPALSQIESWQRFLEGLW